MNGDQLGLVVLPARIEGGHLVDIVNHLGLKLADASVKREFTIGARILREAGGQSLDLAKNLGRIGVVNEDVVG